MAGRCQRRIIFIMNSYELFVANEHPRAAGLPGSWIELCAHEIPESCRGERPPWSWVDRLGSCTQQEYIRLTMAVMVTRVVTEMAEMT